jgi:hypothetical protein
VALVDGLRRKHVTAASLIPESDASLVGGNIVQFSEALSDASKMFPMGVGCMY